MNSLAQDLYLSYRRLRRYPMTATAAAATLALGIGACTAIFSVVDAVLLRPLPYADSKSLVTLWETHPKQPGYRVASFPASEIWRQSLDELSAIAVTRPWRPVLSRDAELLGLEGATVSAGFFNLLGVEPTTGRNFTPADVLPDAPPVVLISYRLWQHRFGGDERLVGSEILLEGTPERVRATVAGVLPPAVAIDRPLVHQAADIFAPLREEDGSSHFGRRYFRVVGRLADGVELEPARSHLAAVSAGLAEDLPETNEDWGASIDRLHEQLAAPVRPALLALLTGVGLLFLVACCNVGILLTSQARGRRQELAVRLALGASGWRVGRQVLTEYLPLSLAGGALGLWLAHQGLALMVAYTEILPNGQSITIDHRAYFFALGLALSTVVLLGLIPAIRSGRLDLRSALAALDRRPAGGGYRPRHALIATELALSSLLLVAAAMLIASFQQLTSADPGFEPRGVTTLRLRSLSGSGGNATRQDALYRRLLQETVQMPDVKAAGLIDRSPLLGPGMSVQAALRQRSVETVRVEFRGVTSQYFEALGIPVIGQPNLELLNRDDGDPAVVVVSQAAARHLWPDVASFDQLLGRRLVLNWGERQSREVIGVVGDVRHPSAPDDVEPTVYLPFQQVPHRGMTMVLRGDPQTELTAAVQDRARNLDPLLVVDQPQNLSREVAASIAEPRARTLLIAIFALSAVLLAAGGAYSVVSLSVEHRRFDSSIRQALGADPGLLVRNTITEMLKPASLGIALGLAGSLLVARALSGLLYGAGLGTPTMMLTTATVMVSIVAIASYLPARRLSNTDPAAALRSE